MMTDIKTHWIVQLREARSIPAPSEHGGYRIEATYKYLSKGGWSSRQGDARSFATYREACRIAATLHGSKAVKVTKPTEEETA